MAPVLGASGIPVVDVGNHLAILKHGIERTIAEGRQYAEMINQIKQDYETLQNTILMVKNQVKMLSSMPQGMNMFDAIMSYSNRLETLMSEIQGISFMASRATGDFEKLYKDTTLLTTAEGRMQLQQRMLQSRMATASLAIKAQSIQSNVLDIYTRLSLLLAGANLTEGIRGMQQVQLQQAALAQHQQQYSQAMYAISQRMETQRQAEEMVWKMEALKDYQARTTLAPLGSWREGPELTIEVRGTP